jgi:alkyl sulfatase BDS1-like metallo-beta-lactamase superfamily hydrolase
MEAIMKTGFRIPSLAILVIWYSVLPTRAQDLGPGFTKVKDGIYVFAAAPENSTCSIIVTQEGVVLIDSCHHPPDSHKVLGAVKKLTDKAIRFLINTETHNDHTTGHFVFSPPAVIINHEGATEASPEMAEALELLYLKNVHSEVVIPGHGSVSTTKIFDEYEDFYTLLLQRVSDMAAQGKTLDQIKKDLKMPEFAHWSGQDRLGVNIDVAYKSVKQN